MEGWGMWPCTLVAAACPLAALVPASAHADFPYGSGPSLKVPAGTTPNDLSGDGNDWKFAATPESNSPYASNPLELFGVRGAHVVDANPAVKTAWQTTTGRPDVTIAATPESSGTTPAT